MTKERRQWSEQQKLQIIQEVEVKGLTPVLRKYDLSQSLLHKWKHRFNQEGSVGLANRYPKIDPEKLSWAGSSASSFYYKPQDGRPGRKPSETTTLKTDGSVATNHYTHRFCCNKFHPVQFYK